jgi:hypothetical protein
MKTIEALNNALEFVEELGREPTLASSLDIKRARLEQELMQALMPPAGEPAAFDPVAETSRIVSASVRKSTNDDNWRKLFWEVAKVLNCLPSSFVDGNEHVLRKAQELQARATK